MLNVAAIACEDYRIEPIHGRKGKRVPSNKQQTSDRVVLNVSGTKFETRPETLAKFPNTLLGDVEKRSRYYNTTRNEHFFNRNSAAFDAILFYYQSGGKLFRPPNVPMDVFAEEILFYELGKMQLEKIQKEENCFEEEEEEILPKGELQRKVWQLFEHPHTSFAARIVAVISVSTIIISITTFCLETLPAFEVEHVCSTPSTSHIYTTNNQASTLSTIALIMTCKHPEFPMPWFAIEAGCIAWFTIEYAMRLISAPEKLLFLRSFLNVIDVIAIVPFYITLPLPIATISSLSILRVLRLVRVFRIFKLSRHSRGLQILGLTLQASLKELCLLGFFVMIGVVLFSSAMYFAGGDSSLAGETGGHIGIPHIFWWAIITMTTVGYGDVWPATNVAKIVGTLCAISGVLTIALPVPVIVSKFEYYYNRELNIQAAKDKKENDKLLIKDSPRKQVHVKDGKVSGPPAFPPNRVSPSEGGFCIKVPSEMSSCIKEPSEGVYYIKEPSEGPSCIKEPSEEPSCLKEPSEGVFCMKK